MKVKALKVNYMVNGLGWVERLSSHPADSLLSPLRS